MKAQEHSNAADWAHGVCCKLENQSRRKKKVTGTEDGYGYEDGGNV
jgi:hypothetical protein